MTIRTALPTQTRRPRAGDLIGYRKDGRPIYLPGGGSEDHDDDSGDGGGDDSGDDSGDGGDDDEDQDLLGDDDSDEGGDDDQQQQGGLTDAQIQQIATVAAQAANQVADKRINQVLNKTKKKTSSGKGDGDGGDSGAAAGPSAADAREARLVYREFVTDGDFKFAVPEERELASELARASIHQSLLDGVDVEDAGRKAAASVQEQLVKVRKSYQRRIVGNLKKQGHLPDNYKAQAKGGPKQRGSDKKVPDGKKIAEDMFPQIKQSA